MSPRIFPAADLVAPFHQQVMHPLVGLQKRFIFSNVHPNLDWTVWCSIIDVPEVPARSRSLFIKHYLA